MPIFGERGEGEREATPPRACRETCAMDAWYGGARLGRARVLDEVPEEDRLPLRIALANNFEGEIGGSRLPQLGNDLARSR